MDSKSNTKKICTILTLLIIIIIILFGLQIFNHKDYNVTMFIDGKKFKSSTIEKNKKISLPKAPEKAGYDFVGWYVNGKKFDGNTKITKDLKLKAKYVKKTYVITFDDGLGNKEKVKVKYKELVAVPTEPIKENYIFTGWYLENEKFDFNNKITSNIKLKAKWDRIIANYKVEHFLMHKDGTYSNTPDEVETLRGNAGSTLEVKTNNYKGYSSPKSKEITINKDGSTIIKYYYTINKYTLNLIGDKGIENTSGSGSYFYGDNINLSYVLKDGYSFNGYDNNVNNNTFVMPDSNITIKVNTKANNDTKYIVKHYKMNIDGTYASPFIEVKTGTTDNKITPKVENYLGFTSPKAKTANINGDGSTIIEYYYKRNKYSLNIEKDKGIKETTGTGEYYFEEEVDVSASLKDGYSFAGWSNDKNDLEFTHKMGAENETIKANATTNTYNITYNLNGGTLKNQVNTYTVETKDFNLGTPTKAGYTFTGWIVNGEKSNGIIKEGTFGDLKVEATYKANEDTKYKIEYYFMDVTGQNYIKNEGMSRTEKGITDTLINCNPENVSGFETPILKDKNETEVDFNTLVIEGDGSTILKYYYPRKKYDLTVSYVNTLDNNDKEGIKEISNSGNYYYEEKVKLSVEVEDGFEFEKWSNGETNTNITYLMTSDDNQTIIANIKRKGYNVTFDSKGGSKVDKKEVLYGKKVEAPTNPTRAGYDFVGWYYKVNEEEKQWNFETNTMPHNDVNLYAKWNIHKNTVVFDANGGTFSGEKTELNVLNQEQGSTITKIEEEPTKLGYTFVGWYKDQDGQNDWQFESDKMPDEALYLYAKWKANTYYIEYEGNTNTSGRMEKTTCTYDKECSLTPNGFEKEYTITYNDGYKNKDNTTQTVKYNFTNWTNGATTYADNTSVTNLTAEANETITLTAQWEINLETTSLKEIDRTGYTFSGWYNNDTIQESLNDVSTNLELTAHWEANTYYVKYDSNKGNGSTVPNGNVENTTHTYDTKSILSDKKYSRDGYQLLGWSKTQHTESVDDCKDCITEANNLTSESNGEVTLYAVWKANTYTITYNGNDNTSGDMQNTTCTFDKECTLAENKFVKEYTVTYDKNDKIKDTTDTQKVGYDFTNWKNGDNTYNNQAKVTNLTSEENGNVTLTAEWQIDESTTKLKDVNRTGYDFDGWFKDNQKLDNLNSITKNLTIQAHWTPITYTIVFDGNGGTKDGKEQVEVQATYDKEIKVQDAFTKTYTLTYDYDSEDNKVDKTQSNKATFNNWKLEDKTYNIGDSLKNLTAVKGEKVILTAQYINPQVTIEENNPSKDSTESYYTYEFKDWSDGNNTYQKEGKITLDRNITLIAEYLKSIDTDKYVQEKLITGTNTSITPKVNNSDSHSYTIDIVNVNDPIINITDLNKIEELLSKDDIEDVTLSSGSNSVTIADSSSAQTKTKEFLSKVTGTTTDKLETEKHLSSLYKKNMSITIDFDSKYAHTKDNQESVTYNLNYTNSNNKIIPKEEIEKVLSKAKSRLNGNKKYIIINNSLDLSIFSLTYQDPSKILIYLNGFSAAGELSGAGIKTAFWDLLGNPKQSTTYPATFIKSMSIVLTNKNGVETEILIKPENVQDDGKEFLSAWKLFGLSLMSDLQKAFDVKDTKEITNATLTELSTLYPFKVKFNIDSDMALEDPYGLEYSFDFVQSS